MDAKINRGELLILTWEKSSSGATDDWHWWHSALEALKTCVGSNGHVHISVGWSKMIVLVRCVDAVSM